MKTIKSITTNTYAIALSEIEDYYVVTFQDSNSLYANSLKSNSFHTRDLRLALAVFDANVDRMEHNELS